MKFRTSLSIPQYFPLINHGSNMLMLGSCFASEMFERMVDLSFDVYANPQGILFNPLSLANSLDRLMENKKMRLNELQRTNELWFSWDHHGSFSGIDPDEVLSNMNKAINHGSKYLQTSDWLILTFGTSYIYTLKNGKRVVGNCHKQANGLFDRRLVSTDIIIDKYKMLINDIKQINPKLNILLTVSPIRHLRDGLIDNSRSKAILLNAVHQLVDEFKNVHYFPSYEFLLDDLRDYRFYKRDKIHPSEEAVDYIWNHFKSSIMEPTTLDLCKRINKVNLAFQHKSLHPHSNDTKEFLKKLNDKMKVLQKDFGIDFKQKIENINAKLSAF